MDLRALCFAMAVCLADIGTALTSRAAADEGELGGLVLGSTDYERVLHSKGCSRVATTSIDQDDTIALSGSYDVPTLNDLLQDHWANLAVIAPGNPRPSPSLPFRQVYLCGDRQVYLISTDYSRSTRLAAVTFAYCSVDEEEGAKLIYEKLGTRISHSDPKFGDFQIFYSQKVVGDKLQQTYGMVPPAISKDIYATAYKKPGGCKVNGKPVGFLYALLFMSKPIIRDAVEEDRQREGRAIQQIKPPPRL